MVQLDVGSDYEEPDFVDEEAVDDDDDDDDEDGTNQLTPLVSIPHSTGAVCMHRLRAPFKRQFRTKK